jgi:hypothetical protein
MVAFIFSLVATFAAAAVIPAYAKRRPAGTPLTWGEAMVGAVYVFFVMFLAWGIMPHQFLTYADNTLQWRKDKILNGPADIIAKLPFTISYEAVRDIIATGLYIVTLGMMIVMFSQWQKRGQEKPKELPTSAYGRPLVKRV